MIQGLLDLARKCRQLANSIYNPQTSADLEAYAAQLETRAAKLEAEARAPEEEVTVRDDLAQSGMPSPSC